jgi:nucleotide-binding universal stress UspA family protein
VQESLDQAREQLSAVIAERIPGTVNARALLGHGKAADEIERAIRREKADLIVIATHGTTG